MRGGTQPYWLRAGGFMTVAEVPASLIKEWVWCPTFAWLATLSVEEPLPPHTLEPEAWDYHEVAEELLTYGRALHGKEYDVLVKPTLKSRTLGIKGVADLVMLSEDGEEALVAEVKTTSAWALREHVTLQLTAYAVMTKETYGVRDVRAYAVTRCWCVEVNWQAHVPKLIRVVRELKDMLKTEETPRPSHDGLRCAACPYRGLCPYAP